MEKLSPKEFVYDLATYLLTSARGCVEEPALIGPLRLVEAISRLSNLSEYANCVERDPFLLEAKKKIDQNKYLFMASEEKFVEFLDELVKEFTWELKRRNGIT